MAKTFQGIFLLRHYEPRPCTLKCCTRQGNDENPRLLFATDRITTHNLYITSSQLTPACLFLRHRYIYAAVPQHDARISAQGGLRLVAGHIEYDGCDWVRHLHCRSWYMRDGAGTNRWCYLSVSDEHLHKFSSYILLVLRGVNISTTGRPRFPGI